MQLCCVNGAFKGQVLSLQLPVDSVWCARQQRADSCLKPDISHSVHVTGLLYAHGSTGLGTVGFLLKSLRLIWPWEKWRRRRIKKKKNRFIVVLLKSKPHRSYFKACWNIWLALQTPVMRQWDVPQCQIDRQTLKVFLPTLPLSLSLSLHSLFASSVCKLCACPFKRE